MEISSFAAQCGYQAIPHTMDGFGDILYLTGKKAEVSPEFVCEAPEKIDSAKRIYHRFRTLSIVFIILSILLILDCVLKNDRSRGSGYFRCFLRVVFYIRSYIYRYVRVYYHADRQGATKYEAIAKRKRNL